MNNQNNKNNHLELPDNLGLAKLKLDEIFIHVNTAYESLYKTNLQYQQQIKMLIIENDSLKKQSHANRGE